MLVDELAAGAGDLRPRAGARRLWPATSAPRARQLSRGATRLARLNAFLQESLQGMTVIQLFAREAHERQPFARLNAGLRRAQFRSTIYEASLYATVEAIGSAARGAAALVRRRRGSWPGRLTFGGLVAFIEYTSRFFLPIRDLGAKYTVMQAAMVSAERIFGLLDTRAGHRVAARAPRSGRAAPGRGAPPSSSGRVVRLHGRATGCCATARSRVGAGRARRAGRHRRARARRPSCG